MKKLTQLSLIILCGIYLLPACTKDRVPDPSTLNHPQIAFFTENFDSASVVLPSLPTGWVAAGDSGWKSDSSNSSTGYTGASSKNNISVSNSTTSGGTFILTSKGISTIGYNDITVTYGARRTKHFSDNGSAITSFAFSTDGGATWTNLQFTESPGDSNWYLINNSIRISLPASAANHASVMFRWTAHLVATPSGTYRIDDFQVLGSSL